MRATRSLLATAAALVMVSAPVVGASDEAWNRIARSPFGAHLPAAAWTGESMVVVDPASGRAASYDPAANEWTEHDTAPAPFDVTDASVWTGSELIILPDPTVGDPMALDPQSGSWRSADMMPPDMYFPPEYAVWTGEEAVVAGGNPPQTAAFDPTSGEWRALERPGGLWVIGLTWTGDDVLIETQGSTDEPIEISILEADGWRTASPGPVSPAVGAGLWADGSMWYLRTDEDIAGPESDAAYDPVTDAWRPVEERCGLNTLNAVAAGASIVDGAGRGALGTRDGSCVEYDRPANGIYGGGARIWTGEEVLFWSGIRSLIDDPKPRGTKLAVGASG